MLSRMVSRPQTRRVVGPKMTLVWRFCTFCTTLRRPGSAARSACTRSFMCGTMSCAVTRHTMTSPVCTPTRPITCRTMPVRLSSLYGEILYCTIHARTTRTISLFASFSIRHPCTSIT